MGMTVPATPKTDAIRAVTAVDSQFTARMATELQDKGFLLTSVDKLANWIQDRTASAWGRRPRGRGGMVRPSR